MAPEAMVSAALHSADVQKSLRRELHKTGYLADVEELADALNALLQPRFFMDGTTDLRPTTPVHHSGYGHKVLGKRVPSGEFDALVGEQIKAGLRSKTAIVRKLRSDGLAVGPDNSARITELLANSTAGERF